MKRFDDLSESEVLALAVANEEEDARIYLNSAAKLRGTYPASARAFEEMAAEEQGHRRRLLKVYTDKFGDELPYITRQDVKGFLKRNPVWLLKDLRLDAIRKQAQLMEYEASQFYAKAAERTTDVGMRTLLTDLAEEEHQHVNIAANLETTRTVDASEEEEATAKRLFLLQVVQPGLAGLIDGSVSTLAPIFAAAFATHNSWNTFVVGLAASIGAGISMGLTEALSDDGEITDRGHPWLRGGICGLMTAIGGLGHTLPYLIPNFWTATIAAMIVVAVELFAIAWIRWKYMETPFTSAIIQVVLGGLLVLVTGIFIGSA